MLLQQHYFSSGSLVPTFCTCEWHTFSGRKRCYRYHIRDLQCKVLDSTRKSQVQISDKPFDRGQSNTYLQIQTLRNFPIEKLDGEVVVVRFDSTLLLQVMDSYTPSVNRALHTIKYLSKAGAKVILVSNWGQPCNSKLLSVESLAECLSSLLQIKVVPANSVSDCMHTMTKELEKANIFLLGNLAESKEERSNCSLFSEKLSYDAGIFVNDAFSLSHKILSSTVGITRFCHSSIAGFHFEEELRHLKKLRETTVQPYIVIIGGRNFLQKANAVHRLLFVCDGLIFVGIMAFQIMHALGKSVPSCYVEYDAIDEATKLIQLSREKNIPLYFPHDLWCFNDWNSENLEIFPSDKILTGWTPADLGPVALKEIFALLLNCKKVLWIGPVKFGSFTKDSCSTTELALMLEKIGNTGCDVTVVGNAACKAVAGISSFSSYKMFENASVVWEFLQGRTLPGVAALDRAFLTSLDWDNIFADPTLPLIVDIGSGLRKEYMLTGNPREVKCRNRRPRGKGQVYCEPPRGNGLFLCKLARRWKHSNFLGLEINNKLVKMCLDIIADSDIKNIYFVSTNATSTFHSIVSSYPGELVLVSIQCPNPDFNKEEHRWRMVQKTLVEAIIDLLATNGKIFLQSDVKAVSTRMREQFVMYGKGKLVADMGDEKGWIEENPFGVRSDWEQHVVDRGDPMYRTMLKRVDGYRSEKA